MVLRFDKRNIEGAPEGGGGAPVAPEAPTPVAPVVEPTAAEIVAPVPVIDPTKPKPEPEAAKPPDLASVLAEFEAQKKKTADLEIELGKQRSETATLAFNAAFDKAGVSPQYRDFLRQQLGAVDPRTEAGLKAIDDLAKRHPAMLAASISTEDPMSTFLRAKAEEARVAGKTSMWSLIPASMMRTMVDGGGE